MRRQIKIAFLLWVAICYSVGMYAQAKRLKEVTSTEGREFYVAWMPHSGSDPKSKDLKLSLVANSRKATTVVVEYPDGSTQEHVVTAGGATWITIDPQKVYWDPAQDEEEKALKKGVRVYSKNDERFTLYSTSETGTTGTNSFDGSHILPVEALGTEYMVQTADLDVIATEFVVMSTQPGITNVKIQLKVNSRRGNTQDLTVALNGPKQIYIVRSKAPDPDDPNDFIDLSGSTICADQPIAVWSGNQYGQVPNVNGLSADHAYDQLLPLNKWGKNFLVPMTQACNTQMNVLRIVSMQDNTTVQIMRGTAVETAKTMAQGETFQQRMVQGLNNAAPQAVSRYITADKPIQVYLYSSSAGMNTWYEESGAEHLPGDPSMTLIPPLDYMTDSTIFSTYNAGEGKLTHQANIWAYSLQTGQIRLDGMPITSGWKALPGNTDYSQVTVDLANGVHTITAPQKSFSGYAYGIDNGQAYLYPVGYDFTPKEDSLFVKDDEGSLTVHVSEWKPDYISKTEGGWHLDKVLLDNGKWLLDSLFVCDSTTLDFPIKTYSLWEKVRWEIEGSIQGQSYFRPIEQYSSNTTRPELEHQFTLLPIQQSKAPYEDFEVRGIMYHKPIICDIPEDKWEKDTFNTIVRVLRQYNDTAWRAICVGDTVRFFRDTVWKVNPATITGEPVEGRDYTMQFTVFNDETEDKTTGYKKYQLGDNVITRHYISSGGCDSLSTIKIFVCQPHYERVDTTVCKDGLWTLGTRFKDFFQKYQRDNSWPIGESILFDTLRAKDCMSSSEFDEYRRHCPKFNGCDSVMELHLNVKDVIVNPTVQNQCMSKGTVYTWEEKNSPTGRVIQVFDARDFEKDKVYYFRDTVRYVNCQDCPDGKCDSVRNILQLQFVSDEPKSDVVHVCQNEKYTYSYLDFRHTFDPAGKVCNKPYDVTGVAHVRGPEGIMCEFDVTVTFYIDTVYRDQMTYDTVCYTPGTAGVTYEWANHPKHAAIPVTRVGLFTYTDTLPTYDTGCDSICVLKLRVGRPYEMPTVKEICDDGAFEWQDTLFYGKNYQFSGERPEKSKLVDGTLYTSRRDMQSQYRCDSILTLQLTINPTYVAERKDTFVCANEPYEFYGAWYNTPDDPWEPGHTYPLEIHDVSKLHGCDSAVLHYVTVYPIYLNEWEGNDTVCQVLEGRAYYEWPGHDAWNERKLQSLNRAGTFQLEDRLQTIHGCDSIIHRQLVVMPTYDLKYSHTMSSEDTVHWENRIYAGMSAVFDNPDGLEVVRCSGETVAREDLQTMQIGTHQCDSVRTLTIRIGQVFRDTTFDATCANCGTYHWILISPITGEPTVIDIDDLPEPYEERIYYDSLKTEMLYDSIYVLRLTAYPTYNFEDTPDQVCQGETYLWRNHMPMPAGVEHRLFVNGKPVTEIPTGRFGTIQVVDSMLTDTIYTNPKTGVVKPMHCDSVWTITLTVTPTYNSRYVELMDNVSMSSNDTLSHFTDPHTLFVGCHFDFDAAGTSMEELKQHYDSVIQLGMDVGTDYIDSVVNRSKDGCDSVHYVHIHICEVQFVQLIDSIGDNDTTWYFGGDVRQEGGSHTLPLVTSAKFHYYDDGTPVDYSVADGREMREYLYIDTVYSSTGCDSIVHDLVRVFPTYRFEFDTAICSNQQYNWRGYTNLNRGRSGYVYDSVGYQVGTHRFDSVYVLLLDVMPSGYWHFDTLICMNDTVEWYHQKIYYVNNGFDYVEASFKDENSPCGDIYHLDLHFAPYYGKNLIEYDTICQYDNYRWVSPGETNEHTEALRDQAGTVLEKIPTDVPGAHVFYDSLKTKSCGCDSTYTLNLFIKPSYHFYDTTLTYCSADTIYWHDQKIYYDGEADVYDTIFDVSTVHACDSNYYLKVHFDLSYDIVETVNLCSDDAHFTWEDFVFDDELAASRLWDEPREYHETREYKTAISGCDSIRRLDLTISPSHDSVWVDTICRGETYYLYGQRLTEPGEYYAVQPNQFGCNNHYYLTLREMPLTTFTLDVEPVCVDESGLANTYLLHFTYEGSEPPVSYSIRYDSLAQTYGFDDEEDVAIAPGQQTLHLPVPYFSEREKYPRPGYYQAVIAFKNAVCLSDSLMTYPFDMEMRYPSWITTQHWNDAIFIMDSTQNGGYSFTAYQWYRNDSILYGETRPYLYAPQYLHDGAEYSVALTRGDDQVTVRTCPIVPDLTQFYPNSPEQTYVSVVPTIVAKENPVVYILSPTSGRYRLLNPQGQLVSQGAYTPDTLGTYPVTLPAASGIYVFQLVEDTTNGTGGDLSRTVKVIVQ